MANDSLDTVVLGTAPEDQIHEDLMDQIYDVSPEDRPFCDATGSRSSSSRSVDWVREQLATAVATNAAIEGEVAGANVATGGERLSNYHQISEKVVKVSDRASNTNTVGTSDELIKQVMKRQKELRRDEEARYTSRLPAVAGNGTTTASETAGVGAWIGVPKITTGGTQVAANTSDRGTSGTDPTLSGGATGGGFPNAASDPATAQTLTESAIKDMMRAAFENGGNPTMAMSVPTVIESLSDFLFTSSARVATLQSNAPQGNRTDNGTGGGTSGGGITAQGAVNTFVTNFGTLELVPNRFQPLSDTAEADLYLIDPSTWERSYLQGYETKPLARVGTAETRQMTVDYALVCLNPEANAVIADIDLTADVTA